LCIARGAKTGLWPKENHDFVRIRRLTMGSRPKQYNPWFYMMAMEATYTTKGYVGLEHPALTGGCAFDQCPAPFAGPVPFPILQIAQATPDKPFSHPQLGSVS
jgi:hypothetical protein